MENIKRIREYINSLCGYTSEKVLRVLRDATDITPEEKNLIFFYLFPRPLSDKELPKRIIDSRGEKYWGNKDLNITETILIIEAGRTAQYERFIKHLTHAFSDLSKVFPIDGSDICNCCLCGKEIYEATLWRSFSNQYKPEELEEKLFLAYGSTETDQPICLPCMINLCKAVEIYKELDPGFIDWTQRK